MHFCNCKIPGTKLILQRHFKIFALLWEKSGHSSASNGVTMSARVAIIGGGVPTTIMGPVPDFPFS